MRFVRIFELIIGVCFGGVIAAGCAADSNENSVLSSFSGSDCKKHADEETFALSALYTMGSADEYPGLRCISWQQDAADAISIDLINFEGGCGVVWEGEAVSENPDQLDLTLVNPPPSGVAACGWCIYDWSFEVTELDIEGDLAVKIIVDTQPSETDDDRVYQATLNTPEADEGIQCQYANYYALQDQAMSLGTGGTLHMPCNEDGSCDEDLICDDAASSSPICVATCVEDSDCLAATALSCQDGRCLLREPWAA